MNELRRNILKGIAVLFTAPVVAGLPPVRQDQFTLAHMRLAVGQLKQGAVAPTNGSYIAYVHPDWVPYLTDLQRDSPASELLSGEISEFNRFNFMTTVEDV